MVRVAGRVAGTLWAKMAELLAGKLARAGGRNAPKKAPPEARVDRLEVSHYPRIRRDFEHAQEMHQANCGKIGILYEK